jgi:hypothetical protein
MTQAPPETPSDLDGLKDAALLDDLGEAQRRQLALRHYLKVGDELIWIDPDRRVRRQRATSVYYVPTARGVYRVSKLTGEVVEV